MKSRVTKNIGFFVCLILGLLFVGRSASAQEPFEKLVDSDTISVTRLNVSQIDSAKVIRSVSSLIGAILDKTIVDEEERQNAKTSLPALVGMFATPYVSLFETLRTNGVDSVYVIGNTKDKDVSEAFFAIPITGQTDEQVQAIRALAKADALAAMNIRFPFVRHGFLFAPIIKEGVADADIKNYIKTCFKELATIDNPVFAKGQAEYPNVAVCIVTAIQGDDVTEEDIANSLEELDLESMSGGAALSVSGLEEYQKTIAQYGKEFANKLESVTTAFTLNELSWSMNLRLKSADDLDGIKKVLGQAAQEVVTQTKEKQNADSAPLTEQLMTALTPQYGSDTVTWTIDKDFCSKNETLLNDIFKKVLEQKAQGTDTNE